MTRPKIVFVNGCFDLLHTGHVRLLEQASRIGETLIVGINSDDSVRNLKGISRPIINERQRLEMVSALRCVGMARIFHELNPMKMIMEINPDAIVKGIEYRDREFPERTWAYQNRKIIHFIDVEVSISTSKIIEAIHAKSALS